MYTLYCSWKDCGRISANLVQYGIFKFTCQVHNGGFCANELLETTCIFVYKVDQLLYFSAKPDSRNIIQIYFLNSLMVNLILCLLHSDFISSQYFVFFLALSFCKYNVSGNLFNIWVEKKVFNYCVIARLYTHLCNKTLVCVWGNLICVPVFLSMMANCTCTLVIVLTARTGHAFLNMLLGTVCNIQ